MHGPAHKGNTDDRYDSRSYSFPLNHEKDPPQSEVPNSDSTTDVAVNIYLYIGYWKRKQHVLRGH